MNEVSARDGVVHLHHPSRAGLTWCCLPSDPRRCTCEPALLARLAAGEFPAGKPDLVCGSCWAGGAVVTYTIPLTAPESIDLMGTPFPERHRARGIRSLRRHVSDPVCNRAEHPLPPRVCPIGYPGALVVFELAEGWRLPSLAGRLEARIAEVRFLNPLKVPGGGSWEIVFGGEAPIPEEPLELLSACPGGSVGSP